MELTTVVCPVCGALMSGDGGRVVCPYCKTAHVVNDPRAERDFAKANVFRESARFREAEGLYQNIIKAYPNTDHADVYWNLLLCQQRVMFETDEKGERFPSFYSIAPEDIETSPHYISAITLAERSDPEKAARFRDMGERMVRAKRMYRTIEETSKPYDIFICFKKTAADGGVTKDHGLAFDLYNHFASKYRVFFSEKSLKDVAVREYEPNIYYGLYTAKIMFLLCSRKEYLESQWVKNEWSRFCAFSQNSAAGKTVIPIFIDDFTPGMLPQALADCHGLPADVHLIAQLEKMLEPVLHPVDLYQEIKRLVREEKGADAQKGQSKSGKKRLLIPIIAAVVIGMAVAVSLIVYNIGKNEEDSTVTDPVTPPGDVPEETAPYEYSAFGNGVRLDRWNLDGQTATIPETIDGLPVVAIGNDAFSGCGSELTSITIPSTVTVIGDSAFARCSSLSGIVIPEGVTDIGRNAFEACENLINVTIPSSVVNMGTGVFSNCKKLTGVTISNGATNIGQNAFEGCVKLTTVTIPASVTTIGDSAFSRCAALKSITIPEGVTSIASNMFANCTGLTSVTIPAGVTSIGEAAFSGCTGLTSITIPANVVSIGYGAFSGCKALTEINYNATALEAMSGYHRTFDEAGKGGEGITVYIGANVTVIPANLFVGVSNIVSVVFAQDSVCESIGDSAFYNCTNLANMTIPASVVSIGEQAFRGCVGLTEVTIGDGVTDIGSQAFSGCSNLASVTIGRSVRSLGENAFHSCVGLTQINFNATAMSDLRGNFFHDAGRDVTGITVCIGANVTVIPSYLFYNASYLTSVTFEQGSHCTGIGDLAFNGCTQLASITLPDSVTTIGASAFNGCARLASITIPELVTQIGENAFLGCTGLIEINFNATAMLHLTSGTPVFGKAGSLSSGITVKIGANVTQIPAYLFYPGLYDDAPKITSVAFAQGSKCTCIGAYAFYASAALSSVTIPATVTSIGSRAFADCAGLTEINFYATALDDLLSGEQPFRLGSTDTQNPITLNIGANVTKIPAYLFYENYNIGTVVFEQGSVCVSIGAYAFGRCTALSAITLPETVTQIGERAFQSCTSLQSFVIPSRVASIGAGAFSYSSLTGVTIPDSVTTIGAYAFSGCASMQSVTIGKGVVSIGTQAFYDCTGLTEIHFNATAMPDLSEQLYIFTRNTATSNTITLNIGANVTQIPAYLFSGVTDMVAVSFASQSQCKTIGSEAFYGCTGLVNIVIPDAVTTIGTKAFYGCTGLTVITIGKGVTTIGNSAFSVCTGVTQLNFNATAMSDLQAWNNAFSVGTDTVGVTVTFGANVTRIPAYLFHYVSEIKVVVFEADSRCADIGDGAFLGCEYLVNIKIPENVTHIGISAFYACSALSEMEFESTEGWVATNDFASSAIPSADMKNSQKAAELFKNSESDWERS
ncbi:MAG: leucine-rich repeat protein [Clostridia bacterium]|nr:leucine-rich repeat protein [Clostridia bacterium]